jgi:hypothetical protein
MKTQEQNAALIDDQLQPLALLIEKYTSLPDFKSCIRLTDLDEANQNNIFGKVQDKKLLIAYNFSKTAKRFIRQGGGGLIKDESLRKELIDLKQKLNQFHETHLSESILYTEYHLLNATVHYWETLFEVTNAASKVDKKLKYGTLISIFKREEDIQKVINVLKTNQKMSENNSLFLRKKYEVSAITEALQLKGIIKKEVSATHRNIIFANHFNFDLSDRTSRVSIDTQQYRECLDEYKSMFFEMHN